MVLVRCTSKVIKFLGERPQEAPLSDDGWYLNLQLRPRTWCAIGPLTCVAS